MMLCSAERLVEERDDECSTTVKSRKKKNRLTIASCTILVVITEFISSRHHPFANTHPLRDPRVD